jgi:GDPmannose 4,6-dehydratase
MQTAALITGISGQDGSYLAELLLANGYDVHGICRRQDPQRLRHLTGNERLHLYHQSVEDFPSLLRLFEQVQPGEVYHLAAHSMVGFGYQAESAALDTNIRGTHAVLAAAREAAPQCRICLAGSSEMFGSTPTAPQNEQTPFRPRSAYGVSKLACYHLMRYFRDVYQLHASCAILFNHESPRRGEQFVTRKITQGVARIKLGLQSSLPLGSLEPRRDWGYAPDFVRAMWLMLRQESPDDFVIATGQTHSVQEFVELAFRLAGLQWQKYVVTDPGLVRPAERLLVGDASHARETLGWQPSVPFEEMVELMLQADLAALQDFPQAVG